MRKLAALALIPLLLAGCTVAPQPDLPSTPQPVGPITGPSESWTPFPALANCTDADDETLKGIAAVAGDWGYKESPTQQVKVLIHGEPTGQSVVRFFYGGRSNIQKTYLIANPDPATWREIITSTAGNLESEPPFELTDIERLEILGLRSCNNGG